MFLTLQHLYQSTLPFLFSSVLPFFLSLHRAGNPKSQLHRLSTTPLPVLFLSVALSSEGMGWRCDREMALFVPGEVDLNRSSEIPLDIDQSSGGPL